MPLSPTFEELSSIRTRKPLEEELGLSAADAVATNRLNSTFHNNNAEAVLHKLSPVVFPVNFANIPVVVPIPTLSSVHPNSPQGAEAPLRNASGTS
ncbi:hypothetical protein PtA15_15A266 [Puccinia triticina]|uniref:Uncharacterized protein n=1 Tax=Puccinia triticina TaxID=208348 RepID=A0ABY7D2N1_9BASI|nr:uncharacterized protein PtA15_15A266 [Puccinia triticina]WAQ91874.1 hypothetical protein PtA15_15A266 [Puccinia triticina]